VEEDVDRRVGSIVAAAEKELGIKIRT